MDKSKTVDCTVLDLIDDLQKEMKELSIIGNKAKTAVEDAIRFLKAYSRAFYLTWDDIEEIERQLELEEEEK